MYCNPLPVRGELYSFIIHSSVVRNITDLQRLATTSPLPELEPPVRNINNNCNPQNKLSTV